MPTRTTYTGLLLPGFIVDQESVSLSYGRQIDFDAAGVDDIIPAGTIMSEVAANGKLIPRKTAGAGAAFGVLLTTADKNAPSDSLTGYGVAKGGGLYQDLLPDKGNAAFATMLTELGARFYVERYVDNRGA